MNAKDIVLNVDYHPQNFQVRSLNTLTGEERCFKRETTAAHILQVVTQAEREALAAGGGRVVWVMESTSGWARVKELLGPRVEFVLANVLQMPLPPKARRRKTDKIDTQRMQREYLNGSLPRAYQPSAWLRQVRRLVDARQDLTERQTTLRGWIWQYLKHETWHSGENLWSGRGMAALKALALPELDRLTLDLKLTELEQLDQLLATLEERLMALYQEWPEAQQLDAVRGIGPITAVTMLAHIGPIARFQTAEQLISYAGLAPGVHQSDGSSHRQRIGGGGTHARLRYFLLQATRWLAEIDRYAPTHQRVAATRGKKVARVVVARMFLRSVHAMLRRGQPFSPGVATTIPTTTPTTAVVQENSKRSNGKKPRIQTAKAVACG
jgi:transposase